MRGFYFLLSIPHAFHFLHSALSYHRGPPVSWTEVASSSCSQCRGESFQYSTIKYSVCCRFLKDDRSPALGQSINQSVFMECTFLAQHGTSCLVSTFYILLMWFGDSAILKKISYQWIFLWIGYKLGEINRKELWDEEDAWEGIESHLLKADILPM